MSDDDRIEIEGTFKIHPDGDKVFTVSTGGVLITMIVAENANLDDVDEVVLRFPDLVIELAEEYERKATEAHDHG